MMKSNLFSDGMVEKILEDYPPGIVIKFMEKLKSWRLQNSAIRA